MVEIDADPVRQVLTVRFSHQVSASDMEAQRDRLTQVLEKLTPGFVLLTDLSDLDSMENAATDQIAVYMDLINAKGLQRVVRVIPDPSKDIGFQLLSIFHYDDSVTTVVCDNLDDAMKALEP